MSAFEIVFVLLTFILGFRVMNVKKNLSCFLLDCIGKQFLVSDTSYLLSR